MISTGFGISSPLWDYAFQTDIVLRKLKFTLKWWLIQSAGQFYEDQTWLYNYNDDRTVNPIPDCWGIEKKRRVGESLGGVIEYIIFKEILLSAHSV